MTEKNTQTYVVNFTFDGGDAGEFIEAAPAVVADWVDAGFISPVDDSGNRVVVPLMRRGVGFSEDADTEGAAWPVDGRPEATPTG